MSTGTPMTEGRTEDRQRAKELVEPSLAALEAMILPSGLFCWDVAEGVPGLRGESVRYTLIVLLGLLRAERAGVDVPISPERLRDAIDAALHRPEVTPGDVALRLWAEVRAGGDDEAALVERLGASLLVDDGLPARAGLELAWIVTALALAARGGPRRDELLAAALDQLIDANQAPNGLFRHFGTGARRRFPNFATEIYSVLALTLAGREEVDERALPAARRAADRLLELQLPDGGWPWLYDAERGTVVERYEVYTVHQHGMAPMTLHELSAVSGDDRYAAAADRGLPWLFGANELNATMVPLESGITYRSIRRRRPLDRLWLYAHTAASRALGGARGGSGRVLELNRTCRPYELGWLVEAWAGADEVAPTA